MRGMKARYNGLDWLRGLAALSVVAVHLSVGTTSSWVRVAAFGSQTGVDLFAVASGFLLAILLDGSRDKPIWGLITHRAARLIPTYLMWTAFYLIALSLLDWGFGVPHGYLAKLSPRFLVTAVLRGAAEVHLWFVPSLFFASVVLIAADRLPWTALRNAWAYLVCGAAIALSGSYIGTNFFCHDVRLFGWVMLGMGLSRVVRSLDASDGLRRVRRFAVFALLPAFVACLFAQGTVLWLVADMAAVLLLMLAFSDPGIPRSRIGAFLSRTSLGVYYFHVFVSRALSIAIRRWHLEPLDFWFSLSLWLLVWLIALAAVCAPAAAAARTANRSNAQ